MFSLKDLPFTFLPSQDEHSFSFSWPFLLLSSPLVIMKSKTEILPPSLVSSCFSSSCSNVSTFSWHHSPLKLQLPADCCQWLWLWLMLLKRKLNQAFWHMPVISTVKNLRQEDLRLAWVTQWDPVSKKGGGEKERKRQKGRRERRRKKENRPLFPSNASFFSTS